jgi:hypothetical protein
MVNVEVIWSVRTQPNGPIVNMNPPDRLTYETNIPRAGLYVPSFHAAEGGQSGATLRIAVGTGEEARSVEIPYIGHWDNDWETIQGNDALYLDSGWQTIILESVRDRCRLDWFELTFQGDDETRRRCTICNDVDSGTFQPNRTAGYSSGDSPYDCQTALGWLNSAQASVSCGEGEAFWSGICCSEISLGASRFAASEISSQISEQVAQYHEQNAEYVSDAAPLSYHFFLVVGMTAWYFAT